MLSRIPSEKVSQKRRMGQISEGRGFWPSRVQQSRMNALERNEVLLWRSTRVSICSGSAGRLRRSGYGGQGGFALPEPFRMECDWVAGEARIGVAQ